MALIPLNTFKTKTAVLTTLKYNQAKCARDTALIIDSIASDLLYGGTTQTAFAAIQYWAQGNVKIPGEVFQTISAMQYAKEIALKIIKNELVELQPIPENETDLNIVTQVTNASPGNTAAATIVDSEFELIMEVIENGIAGTTDRIVPNSTLVSDTGLLNAATLLMENKAFLQQEVSRFVKNRFNSGYKFNTVKCARDTGLIIDSLANDVLFNGSSQSIFSGLQYWSQGSSSIPNESEQTLAAINYLKDLVISVVTNTSINASSGNTLTQITNTAIYTSTVVTNELTSLFSLLTGIISNGTTGITDIIVPNGTLSTDTDLLDVATLLQQNKKFLKTEIVSWINSNINSATSTSIWYNFVYNKDKCFRDVGYILDCVTFDLIYSGNRQTIQAGVYYYGFSDVSSFNNATQFVATSASIAGTSLTLSGNVTGTVAAGQYISGTGVIAGTKIVSGSGTSWVVDKTQNVASTTISSIPVTSSFTSTASSIAGTELTIGGTVSGLIEVGQYITGSGVTPGTYIVSGSGTSWTVNKSQTVNTTAISTASFTSSSSYISGTTLIIGGTVTGNIAPGLYIQGTGILPGTYIIANLSGSGSGSQWMISKSQSVATTPISSYGRKAITSEISESISAYNYLKSIIGKVIEGQPITSVYQQDEKQVILESKGTSVETTFTEKNIDIITNIILNGPSIISKVEPISLNESTNPNDSYAYASLMANKEFLKAEIVAFVNTTTQSGFVYKTTYDAGTFIPGNTYTILSTGTTNFVAIGAADNNPGTTFIASGAGAGTGTATTDFCKRDVGFVVDCVYFDLRHGGNRQAMQAAVYYYSNSSTTSVVASEKTDTLNAYNYMAIVMSAVLQNIPLTKNFIQPEPNGNKYVATAPYQTEVSQYFDLVPATSTAASYVYKLISNVLYPIINLGPSAAPPRLPLGAPVRTTEFIQDNVYKIAYPGTTNFTNLGSSDNNVNTIFTSSTTGTTLTSSVSGATGTGTAYLIAAKQELIDSYNILQANKEYIIAEVIGYMDSLKSPNTTKIYTAPPGVTGIVLMAQAANVTDHEIKVTFAHYRNLPVFADPSTLNGYQAADTVTEIVREFSIPPNDAASLIQGKMIIESFDSIVAYASESGGLKVTLSILETANA